ncbi:IpaB/EvcA family protein [Levilactobacillus suantsaii]|uniref:IpaB/EvcA family protein n=1 Tax=Levilactobacillus suantsaii TaxID=2292255 RepID=A0A4Q0VGX3_9LACO|nr:IpaB/EvcA family protein [Levilactobacillus suantsaii]QMU09067.1 IpaB/EvcA family protein [Levilactobacillus suantsaii]RXI78303.1 IpaB/EvcA family protein [Levilactobacillus suantsaii]
MEAKDVQLSPVVQGLINEVNGKFPGKVEVQFIGQLQSGYVRHDQAQQVQDGNNIVIQVADLTAPNYTASHELLHLLMILSGFPQVFFSLTTGNTQLDEQLMIMGTELYDIVSHIVVVSEQRKHELITPEIEEMYLKGVRATIKPEPTPVDDEMTLRTLTLLDALVFFGDGHDDIIAQFKRDYPISLEAAQKLYALITAKPIDSPFTLRRNVVKLFRAFDEQLEAWHLPALHNAEFTTLTSVVSKRQLGLQVRQMFELYHSDMHDKHSQRRAYVGFNRADNQNAFVLSAPKPSEDTPDYYTKIYDMTVADLFKMLKMPYILR